MKIKHSKIIHGALFLIVLLLAGCGGGGGTADTSGALAITSQPTDQSVVEGMTATLTVVATGAIGYQWQISADGGKTFTGLSDATSASYTTAATKLTDSGTQYRVVVNGAGNSVNSSAVTLTVTATTVAPGISVQPADQAVAAGQNASFSVTATGSALGYQWQRKAGAGFADMAGENGATLNLTAVALADDANQFRVAITNSAGSITSNAATLSVHAAPVIPAFTLQPAGISVVSPDTATFNVTVSGTPSPSLQWQVSTDSGTNFIDIDGATLGSYTTLATSAGDNGKQLRVIATSSAGATNSNAAILTVTVPSAPGFAMQPAGVTNKEGQNAQFTVAATGAPSPTLQWQFSADSGASWSNITGATGAVYDISVQLANSGRQYRAVATNRVGTVNSNSASLTVQSKAWGTAALIETDNTGGVIDSQLAIDTNGNGLAVWTQSDGTRNNVWANRFTVGQGWGTAALIETDNSGAAYTPQIAIDSNGNAIAVWYQYSGSTLNIWGNRYTAGSGWGTATLLESNTSDAVAPQVAMDSNGNALVVWVQYGAAIHIWANRYTAGAGWGTAAAIETDSADSVDTPQVAFDANGNAMAVWVQTIGSVGSICANRFTAGTGAGSGWGTATLIESGTGSAYGPQVVADASGNALAVWAQTNGTVYSVWANRFTAGSGWGTAALIETDVSGHASAPQIAIDLNGNAMTVWSQASGPINNIWANRYGAGTGWGSAELIETDNGSYADNPKVAFDTKGNAMAVWNQYRPITYNRYINGIGWGTAARVDPNNSNQSTGNPHIAIDSHGNALAVWVQDDGTRYSMMANYFQ